MGEQVKGAARETVKVPHRHNVTVSSHDLPEFYNRLAGRKLHFKPGLTAFLSQAGLPPDKPLSRASGCCRRLGRSFHPFLRVNSAGELGFILNYRFSWASLAEPACDVGVESSQRGGVGALRAARAALRVPCHDVEIRPPDAGCHKLLQISMYSGGRVSGGPIDNARCLTNLLTSFCHRAHNE